MVLIQDTQSKSGIVLHQDQLNRLSKSVQHYMNEVYKKHGDKDVSILNKDVLTACSKDFLQYLQRKEITKQTQPVQEVLSMSDSLFKDTSFQYERKLQERKDVKALPPAIPDFKMLLSEDGPPAAELYEIAKKQRENEMLHNDLVKADIGIHDRIQADSLFRTEQDSKNKKNEIILRTPSSHLNQSQELIIMPDRRELLNHPIGSFDGMNSNDKPLESEKEQYSLPSLQQFNIIPQDNIISYREIENNLFIYSADRDWLRNQKENRYHFTVQFDPATNGHNFGPTLASQQKFKNIVRIELVKVILPGENTNVTISRTRTNQYANTSYQDNILNLPYISLRVSELDNNSYGTNNNLDDSFGVLQYDAQWLSDSVNQTNTRGFIAMIPKYLKCQKEYYPTPLSTLQKMTIDIRRPSGELVSTSPDTFDIGGIIATQTTEILGTSFPFTNAIKFDDTSLQYNTMVDGFPANFYINTVNFFSKFEITMGDRIQISGYTYSDTVLNDPTYGQSLRSFCTWVNRSEGHIVLDVAHSIGFDISYDTHNILDSYNDVGYANFFIIQARYNDPKTGDTRLNSFDPNIGAVLNAFGVNLQSPIRCINLNKQLHVTFRIITREMDSLPQIRPNNNY